MKSIARSVLLTAMVVSPAISGDARADETTSPDSAAASEASGSAVAGSRHVAMANTLNVARADHPSGQPGPPQPTSATTDSGDDESEGPSMVLGIGGLAIGIAGFAASVGLLAAAENRSTEASDISARIKSDPAYLGHMNQCGDPDPHPSCGDLKSAADDKVSFTAAGFFLLVAGSSLTLTSALYLAVGGGADEENEQDEEVALQVMPTIGPSQWGATIGGTF